MKGGFLDLFASLASSRDNSFCSFSSEHKVLETNSQTKANKNLKSEIELQPRIDLREKVTGQAQYIEDLPDLPFTAYAATLLSPYSHARILSIDASEAERSPGVLAVLDREHLDGQNPRLKLAPHEHLKLTDDQDFIAINKVRFDGEQIGRAHV